MNEVDTKMLDAYVAMKHIKGYITGVKEQVEHMLEYVRCDENLAKYIINSYKYTLDWIQSGIDDMKYIVGDTPDKSKDAK